jgi:hypothetical protein
MVKVITHRAVTIVANVVIRRVVIVVVSVVSLRSSKVTIVPLLQIVQIMFDLAGVKIQE